MKSIFTLFLSCAVSFCFAQGFYDMDQIQTIEINFEDSNWDQLLDAAYASDLGYIMAQNVTINGASFDSVGVKYKGNSTYNSNQTKNPFHIELDTYKDQDYQGYKDIKLSNGSKDPSGIREVLSYQILRQYMVAPQSNYANVYVNGNLIGLYSNSESITKTFTNSHFGSKGNTFVKCNPPAGAGPQASAFPDLVYLGEDSIQYYEAYELKTETGWNELIDLCDTLANEIEAIEEILDVDKALWMLAYNNVLVNLDSYIGAFTQNYYLYRDDYGRFLPIIWDLNESFGRFSMSGSINLNNTTSKQQMDHLLHDNDPDFPLIQQLLEVPMYKRMYLAHYKTIVQENFSNGSYYDTGLMLQELIDESVQADDNYLFTYANFQENLDDDVSAGGGPGPMGGSVPGIANLMDGRATYLMALSNFTALEPTIDDIQLSNTNPIIGESMFITVQISDGNNAVLGYRNAFNAPFTRLQMYDDGAHNDGMAGDGIYGTELMIENAFVQYYIYAENDNIGKFSPVRAEHEYHTLTATTVDIEVGDLVINEFIASNDATIADQDGEYDDWIELYNNGTAAINLEGYYLSDDAENIEKWEFPAVSIEPGGYLIIWADDDTDQEGLHASFKLSAASESILLSDEEGNILDEVSYVNQESDVSYGRFPNGTGSFISMAATFGAENMMTSNTTNIQKESFEIQAFPNPAREYINLVLNGIDQCEFSIYYVLGNEIQNGIISNNISIDTSNWDRGIYFVKCQDQIVKILIH